MPLLEFIFGLAILIILHEMGHFVAARMFKIEVEEFGIGFPPRLATLFTAGGTQFTFNAIPLGGFVRPKGENDPSVPGGLAAANPWVRLCVLAAGPFTNLAVAAILAVVFVYSLGEPVFGRVLIEGISENSPAERAGLQPGDLILKANGKEFQTADQLKAEIDANLGQPMELTYQRGDQVTTITITPRNPPPTDGAIGIAMGYQTRPTTLGRAIPGGLDLSYQYVSSLLKMANRIF
jgi:regulator of sigma E protease